MPYTPPSQLSPATSKQSTPTPSRSPSYINHGHLAAAAAAASPTPTQDGRPHLPRSAGSSSYLSKHRRSPSLPTGQELPEVMSDFQRGVAFDPHGSLRQSPPPVTNGLIPSGMTISPPESSHNSDDEEVRGRSRELEMENLTALHDAIRGMNGQRKSGSPVRRTERPSIAKFASEGHSPQDESPRPPISSSQRKVSHNRSHTDGNISITYIPEQALLSPRFAPEGSDSEESDGPPSRPPMVRKKSGELVKPALRPHSRRRPSSMPGTPTYSKAVHFDSQLEHIRHFLQVDRPLAVSAGSSPVENYESETEFPFGSEEANARHRGPAFEWELRLANFSPLTDERRNQPVFVDRIFLSADNKTLIGSVAVQNLAFQKSVVARFTLDYWKTTSEVTAEYNNDTRRNEAKDELDRFNFSISLADQANLENKTLFFCVRYAVNGTEYWDSNNNVNYQVDFIKRPRIRSSTSNQPTGLGARPLNALPRSRPSPPVSAGRPKSMPVSFDDFATDFDNFGVSFVQSPSALIGEPKMKLRSPRSKQELVPDAPAARRHRPAAPLFGHRYDFNSSLTAAKNTAQAVLGDQSGLRPTEPKQTSNNVPVVTVKLPQRSAELANGHLNTKPVSTARAVSPSATSTDNPALFAEKPDLSSQSYQELVDKYCFFGTGKASVAKPFSGAYDGADDRSETSSVSSGSPSSSASSSPILGRQSPSPPSDVSSVKAVTPMLSRSSSTTSSCMVSRSSSPAAFGYLYHDNSSQTLLAEAPQSMVILG